MGIEDNKYTVYVENRPKEILFTGTIWDCERWVSKNGIVDTAYIIDCVKEKRTQIDKTSDKQKKKRTRANTHSETPRKIKEISNIVESLF